jgi:hypothetical protein
MTGRAACLAWAATLPIMGSACGRTECGADMESACGRAECGPDPAGYVEEPEFRSQYAARRCAQLGRFCAAANLALKEPDRCLAAETVWLDIRSDSRVPRRYDAAAAAQCLDSLELPLQTGGHWYESPCERVYVASQPLGAECGLKTDCMPSPAGHVECLFGAETGGRCAIYWLRELGHACHGACAVTHGTAYGVGISGKLGAQTHCRLLQPAWLNGTFATVHWNPTWKQRVRVPLAFGHWYVAAAT